MATVQVKSLYGKMHLYDQIIPLGETRDYDEETLATPEVEMLVERNMIEIIRPVADKKEAKKEEAKKPDPNAKKAEEV